MGGFVGHSLAGAFFLLFSLWWFIGIVIGEKSAGGRNADAGSRVLGDETARSARTSRIKHNQQVWFACPGPLSKIPVEPIVKIVTTVSGMIVELAPNKQYELYNEDGEFLMRNLNDHGHVAMYSFFAFSGVVDLVMWYRLLPLPAGTDYIVLSMAFWVEGMLFYFHLDGRPELDLRMHTFLYLVIFLTAAVLLVAMVWEKSPLLSTLQAYLTALQGSWFIQIAFALHGPKIWKNTPTNVMILPIVFAWHMLFWLVSYLIFFAIVSRCFTFKRPSLQESEANETVALMEM